MTQEASPNHHLSWTRAFLLAATVALLPSTALGQDGSPAPSDEPPAMAEATPAVAGEMTSEASGAAQALLASLPAELAGVPLDPANVTVLTGQDITQGSETLVEQYRMIEEATGVGIDDMTLVNAFVQTPDEDLVFLGAITVPGADASLVRDVVVELALETGNGTIEEVEIGGLSVTAFVEDGLAASNTYIHPVEDVLWLVLGPADAAAEALAHVSG